jgi:hypothetical protein
MMVRTDHNGQEPAGPMAITLGYQEKSVERHRFHMRVTSVLREDALAVAIQLPPGIIVDELEPPCRTSCATGTMQRR